MQRQSLGSPSSSSSSKIVKDEQLIINETQKQFPSQSPSSSSSISTISGLLFAEECKENEQEMKKLMRLKPKASTTPETYIHLIPMLTLLCFLILYLSSHDPSQNDLAQFSGFKAFSNSADSEDNISELKGVLEIKKGDILAVRSLKNFKLAAEQGRLHRKIGHL